MIRYPRPYSSVMRPAVLGLALLALPSSAFAQGASDSLPEEEAASIDDMGEDGDAVDLEDPEAGGGEDAALDEGEEAAAAGGADEGRKPDGSTQLLMGMRYRALITPKFLINMFGVDGGRTVVLHGVGPEIGGYFGKTADGFMVLFSPWYAGYGLDKTAFKGKKDDDSAWEIIESDMKVWYLTIDAMWDHKLMDRLSVNVGIGAGLGIVAGELRRNEAYVDAANGSSYPGADPKLSVCAGPGQPNSNECPGDGNYDIAQGGKSDRWPVYPWLNFQAGLRYQPVDEFVGRLDFGLGSSGFWIGLGADYSLFL